MSQSDPLTRLAQMAATEDSRRAAQRAAARAISPELTEIMDNLGSAGKMRHITVNGVTVAGKAPEADPASWVTLRGEFVVLACAWGRK